MLLSHLRLFAVHSVPILRFLRQPCSCTAALVRKSAGICCCGLQKECTLGSVSACETDPALGRREPIEIFRGARPSQAEPCTHLELLLEVDDAKVPL